GAAAEFALHENVSAALLDDAVDRREAETCAFAFFFRGEERFEDAGLGVAVHALAVVADGDHHIGPVLDVGMFGTVGLVVHDSGGAYGDFAAFGERVFGVDDEVHDDLLELSGIGAGAADR